MADVQAAEVLLLDPSDRCREGDGVRAAQGVLTRYAVTSGPSWWASPALEPLAEPAREELRERTGGLLVLLGRGLSQQAVREAGTTDPTPALRRAFDLNTAALACYPDPPSAACGVGAASRTGKTA